MKAMVKIKVIGQISSAVLLSSVDHFLPCIGDRYFCKS